MKKWVILSVLFSLQSQAASISTYRIYLDSEHRQQKFMVKNRSAIQEECEVSFDYQAYLEGADIKKLTNEERSALSEPATNRLRYSPRKFTLEPQSTQYIAFSYKRQINDEPAEHRTYAIFTCLPQNKQALEGINLSPTIVHSIPLVIRTGKAADLDVSLTYSQIKRKPNNIGFRLEHQGTRSVYGDIHLMNGDGETIELLQKNVVLYPEMKYKDFQFRLPNSVNKNSQIVFQETGPTSNKKRFNLSLSGE